MNMQVQSIRLLILDVDGVLTDGRISLDHLGREAKTFHARDGLGIRAWIDAGHEVAILTGRRSTALTHRMRELGVRRVVQGAKNKRAAFESLLAETGVAAAAAAAMGDDLNDLPMLAMSGYPMTVADAAAEVRERCRFVSRFPGGGGAVREAVEHLLKAQGLWPNVVERFAQAEAHATPHLPNGTAERGGISTAADEPLAGQ